MSTIKGAAGKGKKTLKPGAEDKREDVLQAVIIADSFQTRFIPFSLEKPRCLFPLANTPLIEYTLEFLAMNGVQEVFIYAGAHQEQIESYIRQSRWTPISRSCPFVDLQFIRVSDARSIGDFLRDLDKRSIIGGDFVLVHGDLVSNVMLDGALAAHRARKEANRDAIMTMVLREGGEHEHQTKVNGITPIFALDPRQRRCLHYEEMNPFQEDRYTTLDEDVLKNHELEIRTDLIDAQIDICTPDVLALWSESFDYELPRANYLHGVLKDYELNGKTIHTEIVSEGYSARATNLQMFEAISRDVLSGWAYPFVPDSNLVKGHTYKSWDDNVYREDGVQLGVDCDVSSSILGRDTQVGPQTTVSDSVIGRNCRIGSNVRISDSYIWDDAIVEDGAVVEHSLIAEYVVIGKSAHILPGSLLASGVHVSDNITIRPSTVLSILSSESTSVPHDTELLGPQGKGARYKDPDFDDLDEDDPVRLQKSLIYTLDDYNFDASTISTFSPDFDEDTLAEFESHQSPTTNQESRSRLSSFASDDSGNGGSGSFLSEAVHGLLDALRGEGGDFDSEKLEFMSLRLANDASDVAVRRAVATAFVRRAVELLKVDGEGLEPSKAAKTVLTERPGAQTFVAEVGVGSGSVKEQIEFALAVQRACVSSAKVIEVARAGNLLAALFQHMYQEEILEEDGILGWWIDSRASEGEGAQGENMRGVKEKCKVLVDWLEDAEEEDSDESDDE
ncbi:nucleotide-diphospho-sugar transferase [Pseudomassariella vexata]|uniref:Mannose-1-phosphate guanyltransferase n=1 Tax=Pseudomassariella vexata TaxID=1141098 RepID=A0A1Y2DI43_9PEZI|nr:nucleotide-diphospho-sugar transferase [Pseudomassariella vexata]ORY58806.1 nucleotide-diphospho-sugar transferase [Pseudomassariella vexata]